MCCRYTIAASAKRLAKKFNAQFKDVLFQERFNASPSQNLPIITNQNPRLIQLYKWGFLPNWAKNQHIGNKMLNARAETIVDKPAYKKSFSEKRCLVIADGFYEWKKTPKGKIPYRITLKNQEPFAFAGIYNKWHEDEKDETNTFCIITTSPNSLIKNIHDRMPVILKENDYNKWLDTEIPDKEAQKLLKPYDSAQMEAYEVSKMINSPTNDFPEIIKPV